MKLRDKAMHRLGIGTTHDMQSVITGIFLPSWRFPGYTLTEKVQLWRGRSFSRSFGLWDQLIWVDLRETVPRLRIPRLPARQSRLHLFHGFGAGLSQQT